MNTWQTELQNSVQTLEDLKNIIPLSELEQEQYAEILENFPMLATPYYLSLIDFEDENDPIRKMAIPSLKEADRSGSFDTSGEASNTIVTGLQHKYTETAMMLSTSACAMYCRHCFRKRLVGLDGKESAVDLAAIHTYISNHPEISNVLISGGDALMNSNKRLAEILDALVDIPHLDFIRIASRVLVTLPSRVTDDPELLEMLAAYNAKKKLYVVTHFNHSNEISPESIAAVKAFLDIGIPVRNQTVLLRGINDDAIVLGGLLKKLTSIGAEPYYVFQCRPVTGVKSHFQVPIKEGYRIVEAAKAMQNGVGKAFRYCMSTVKGKIEVAGILDDGKVLFKYHEAKDPANLGSVFTAEIADTQAWLD